MGCARVEPMLDAFAVLVTAHRSIPLLRRMKECRVTRCFTFYECSTGRIKNMVAGFGCGAARPHKNRTENTALHFIGQGFREPLAPSVEANFHRAFGQREELGYLL